MAFLFEWRKRLLFQCKNREENEDSYDRHSQSANGSSRQWEPKSFLACTYHKWDETKNGRNHGQEDRYNLGIPCLDKSPDRYKFRETTTYCIVFIQNIDAGIHRNTAEQDKRSKTALVEVQSEQVEGQEDTDIRNRYYKDDGQRLLQRVEQDTGCKEDDGIVDISDIVIS